MPGRVQGKVAIVTGGGTGIWGRGSRFCSRARVPRWSSPIAIRARGRRRCGWPGRRAASRDRAARPAFTPPT